MTDAEYDDGKSSYPAVTAYIIADFICISKRIATHQLGSEFKFNFQMNNLLEWVSECLHDDTI